MIGCPKCKNEMQWKNQSDGIKTEWKNKKLHTKRVLQFQCTKCGEKMLVLEEGMLTRVLKRWNANESNAPPASPGASGGEGQ